MTSKFIAWAGIVRVVAIKWDRQTLFCSRLALIKKLQVQEHARCHRYDHQCRKAYSRWLHKSVFWPESLNGKDRDIGNRSGEEVQQAVAVDDKPNTRCMGFKFG
jgi:hypothetical protein